MRERERERESKKRHVKLELCSESESETESERRHVKLEVWRERYIEKSKVKSGLASQTERGRQTETPLQAHCSIEIMNKQPTMNFHDFGNPQS